jgi:WhiB family redox-sensing transcriptional regulator
MQLMSAVQVGSSATGVGMVADDVVGAVVDQTWREHAVCKGRTQLFFPPKAERPQARARREAKARLLCTACAVRVQCQEFARASHEYGFWGGESEEDRHLAGYTVAAPIGIRARAYVLDATGSLDHTGTGDGSTLN